MQWRKDDGKLIINKTRSPHSETITSIYHRPDPPLSSFYTTFKSFSNRERHLLVIRRGRGPVPPFPALLPVPRVCRGPTDGGGRGAGGASHAWSWSQSGWACGASSQHRILIILTLAVLRIRGCLCRILDPGSQFFHPGYRSKRSRIRIKVFKEFFTQKLCLSCGRNYLVCSFIPDPGCGFFPIPNPDPGSRVKKAQSVFRIRNTAKLHVIFNPM